MLDDDKWNVIFNTSQNVKLYDNMITNKILLSDDKIQQIKTKQKSQ